MNDVKKKLLEEIDRKIARKKQIRAHTVENNTHEAYIMAFIRDMEDLRVGKIEGDTWFAMMTLSLQKLEEQMRTLDFGCNIEISWYTNEGKDPQVNGVLIKWSPYYQAKNNLEPELFIDIVNLLFR